MAAGVFVGGNVVQGAGHLLTTPQPGSNESLVAAHDTRSPDVVRKLWQESQAGSAYSDITATQQENTPLPKVHEVYESPDQSGAGYSERECREAEAAREAAEAAKGKQESPPCAGDPKPQHIPQPPVEVPESPTPNDVATPTPTLTTSTAKDAVATRSEQEGEVKKPNMYEDGSYWVILGIHQSRVEAALRMQRFVKAGQKGKAECSPDIAKMFGNAEGRALDSPFYFAADLGEKLHQLLLQHGDMKAVNVVMTRQTEQINEEEVEGEWYTEAAIKLLPGWTEPGSQALLDVATSIEEDGEARGLLGQSSGSQPHIGDSSRGGVQSADEGKVRACQSGQDCTNRLGRW